MDLFCNVDTGVFQTSITNQQPIQFLTFKRRDTARLNLYFVQNGSNLNLDAIDPGGSGATLASLSVGLKNDGDYASAFLAFTDTSTFYDDVSHYYGFLLSLNTSELDSLFTADSEISSISTMLEFQWKQCDGAVFSSTTLPVLIQNDVIRGDEPVLALANPSYPNAASVFTFGTFATASAFPSSGVLNKLYQANDSNFIYSWNGSAYERIQATILTGTGAPTISLGATGDLYFATNTSVLYQKAASSWTGIANLKGNTGATGPANTLSIGTVSSLSVGTAATATITGTAPTQTLDLGLPTGATGATGPANSLSIGTVSSLSTGSSATASITGTAPTQTLNLGLPTGATGATGATGPANSLTIGTVSTLSVGSSATASVTGTAPTQTLNLGIPTGATGSIGATGPANTLSIGTVSTGTAGTNAAATITGTAPTQTLNLTIPAGAAGSGTYTKQSSNFTAAVGVIYVTTGSITVTDPSSPAVGDSYTVYVGSGTATIGGTAYAVSKLPIVRYYSGSAWSNLASVSTDNLTLNGTNNTAPNQTAAGSFSIMTQSLSDARAGVIYNLIQASDVSASNQTYVNGTSITLPAGTYVFRGSIMADTASTTSGINAQLYQNGAVAPTGFAAVHSWTSTTQQSGFYAMTAPTNGQFRSGTNWYLAAGSCFADAPNKTVFSETQGIVTVGTGGCTFTFQVAQRTAVDGTNAVYLRANSYMAFTKIS